MSLYVRCKKCGYSYINRNNNLSGSCRNHGCSGTNFDVILLENADSIYNQNSKTFPSDRIEEEYDLKVSNDIEKFKKFQKGKTALYSIIGLDDEVLYIGQAGNIVDRINKWLLHGDGLSSKTWHIERNEVKEVYIFVIDEVSERDFNEWKSKGWYGQVELIPHTKLPNINKLADAIEFAAIEWFKPVFNIAPGKRNIDIEPVFFYEASYIKLKYVSEVSINERIQNKLEFLKRIHEKLDEIDVDCKRLRVHYDGLLELFKRFSLFSHAFRSMD